MQRLILIKTHTVIMIRTMVVTLNLIRLDLMVGSFQHSAMSAAIHLVSAIQWGYVLLAHILQRLMKLA